MMTNSAVSARSRSDDGVERTRLGYDMLVKLKLDELLGQAYLSEPRRDPRPAPDTVVAASGTR